MLRLGLVLMVIGAVFGGALAFVNGFTEPRIKAAQEAAFQASLQSVLPEADTFERRSDLKEKAPESAKSIIADGDVYLAKSGGDIIGLVVTTKPYGYSSTPLTLLVGIDRQGRVSAAQVTSQSETPGLGTKTAEAEFLTQPAIAKATVQNELKVKKDGGQVDAVTGATLSSRAVVRGINAASALYRAVAAGLGLAY